MKSEKRISLRLSKPIDVRKTLSRVANMVVNNELDTKIANTIILCCNAILSSIRTDEQEKHIEELERYIDDYKL